ncbi:hypothetical protein BDZ45DRAFT_321066 [Acephala macrosclerotiorum]|nr:hypothetical protein BDZ45DRAFT_321066 [Acephala macrosclerotiorum]
MRENINKVTQRGERLDSLQGSRSDEKAFQPGNCPSQEQTSDALQAKTNEIVAIMRNNIEAVTERREHRLMYGTDPDDCKLSEQSKRFYLKAKRRQNEGLLTKIYRSVSEGITRAGSEGYRSIRGFMRLGPTCSLHLRKMRRMRSRAPIHNSLRT